MKGAWRRMFACVWSKGALSINGNAANYIKSRNRVWAPNATLTSGLPCFKFFVVGMEGRKRKRENDGVQAVVTFFAPNDRIFDRVFRGKRNW